MMFNNDLFIQRLVKKFGGEKIYNFQYESRENLL